ncbi:MAG: hypothetical protein JWM85_2238 [Acidimicrobiaceae bacterium]|nr:hypothetical protein [Acidimicrobiaceae bacterium]
MADRDLWVDFNDADHQNRISTLLRFADVNRVFEIGESVVVGDDEGNFCHAVVEAIGERVIDLVLNPATFDAADQLPGNAAHLVSK